MTERWNTLQRRDDDEAVYEEYVLDGTRVAVLSEPENLQAWIQSDVTVDVEP